MGKSYAISSLDSEKTCPQVTFSPGELADEELIQRQRTYWQDYRKMRYDPTIAFARMLTIAPIVSAGWQYKANEDAPKGALELIEQVFEPLRTRMVKLAMEGYCDHGWAAFEMVKGIDENGNNVIAKAKHLLQMHTIILVDKDNGEYVGLRQIIGRETVNLPKSNAQTFFFDYEGTDWYGVPLMENARQTQASWDVLEQASQRYDKKIAGSHWLIQYPVGQSPFGANKTMTDNYIIATMILDAIQSSGKMVIPRKIELFVDDMNNKQEYDAWKIELLSDQGAARTQFIERARYLDALKVRAFGIPERSILEGQFGTKAESQTQSDFAIINIEVRHGYITEQISQQSVDEVLEFNFGREARGSVYILPNPLTDDKVEFLRKTYANFLADRNLSGLEHRNTDMESMRTTLGIPGVDNPMSDEDYITEKQEATQKLMQQSAANAGPGTAPTKTGTTKK